MVQTSSQAEVAKVKVFYTTKEVIDSGILFDIEDPPPSPTKCKFCGQTLYYEGIVCGRKVIGWKKEFPQRCTCKEAQEYWQKYDKNQEEKEAEEKTVKEQEQFNKRVELLVKKSGIKQRFFNRTFENYKISDKNRAAYNTAKKYADEFEFYEANGKGIYFEGTCGTGKTHLAVSIALQLLRAGIPVICKTSIDILKDIKSTYESETLISEKEVFDRYKNIRLLIIDDFGKEQCTDWSTPAFYEIINDRYEQMKPTIITTNYNEDSLIKRLTPKGSDNITAEAIISRFRECTDVVTMAWEDYRSVNNE